VNSLIDLTYETYTNRYSNLPSICEHYSLDLRAYSRSANLTSICEVFELYEYTTNLSLRAPSASANTHMGGIYILASAFDIGGICEDTLMLCTLRSLDSYDYTILANIHMKGIQLEE